MKLQKRFAAVFILGALSLGLAGCKAPTSTMPMAGGYEEVSHPVRTYIALDEPQPPRVSFQHRGKDDKITEVWPALYGAGEVIHGDLAIFVGDRAYMDPDRVTHARLFAVKSPALPVDITDEVLRLWAKAAGRDFKQAAIKFTAATPEENERGLKISLEFSTGDKWVHGHDDWPDQSSLQLDWSQLDQVIQTVKAKGIEQKDLRWKTPYIGEAL